MSVILKTPSNGSVTLAEQDTASNVTVTIPATTGNAVISTPDLAYSPYVGFRNRIINGGMTIDQRNGGATVTALDSFAVDRWQYEASQTLKFTLQQNAGAVTPPAGFTNYLGATSSSAYSVGASDYFLLGQKIEGFNVADLGWGTANAQTVTLSFLVRSSLTGTFGGAVRNSAGNRSYPFSYTISAANTFEYKTITIPGDTSGTWITNSGLGVRVGFSLGVGATFSGTAGAWAGSNFFSATGATSVVGTSGATFYITGVQLEKGSTATPFEFRAYGQELALCQRYYIQKSCVVTTSSIYQAVDLPVSMRTSPTIGTVTFESGTGATFATASGSALAGVDKVTWVYQGANHSGIAISMIPLSAEL